jgi:hypothetical protein
MKPKEERVATNATEVMAVTKLKVAGCGEDQRGDCCTKVKRRLGLWASFSFLNAPLVSCLFV